ncbi:hypothetical protein Cgig2_027374 [Carnegiea gigantea]|uniref:Uncharacterized protein n=1 Tax=Carnegiea gigantea TaxID=171969 RepID=A0A9Q1QGU8_9CARY|nr:hypothetical protein Cgig2_027374 [Carnegiea gigantea]
MFTYGPGGRLGQRRGGVCRAGHKFGRCRCRARVERQRLDYSGLECSRRRRKASAGPSHREVRGVGLETEEVVIARLPKTILSRYEVDIPDAGVLVPEVSKRERDNRDGGWGEGYGRGLGEGDGRGLGKDGCVWGLEKRGMIVGVERVGRADGVVDIRGKIIKGIYGRQFGYYNGDRILSGLSSSRVKPSPPVRLEVIFARARLAQGLSLSLVRETLETKLGPS